MNQYFPKPFRSFRGNINFKVDLSNYSRKADIKKVMHIDTFALKSNLASLKTEVDKLDIDKLVSVIVDLCKLGDAVKIDVDTSQFDLKVKYNGVKAKLEKKIPDVTGLVKKTKFAELEKNTPDVSGLVTKLALTVVEGKIPDVRSLVKKTNYDTEISELEKKLTDYDHD